MFRSSLHLTPQACNVVIAGLRAPETNRSLRFWVSLGDSPVALNNFSETFPLFAALVLAVLMAGKSSQLSEWGAGLYFVARLVYLLLYAFGVPLIRSLVWNVATLGIILLFVALLWG